MTSEGFAEMNDAERWEDYARRRIESLTMPRWALGRVCDLMVDLVRIQKTEKPRLDPAAIVVLAADHGIASQGVSAYPPVVTSEMIRVFLSGSAAVGVLARQHGLPLYVVDMGTCGPELSGSPTGYLAIRLQRGTANFLDEPAMSRETATRAIDAGRSLPDRLGFGQGLKTVLPGEMGIGATTSAAALASVLLDLDAEATVGRGTGIDDRRLAAKIDVVRRAAEEYGSLREDPLGVLAAVGGLEIAGLVGLILEAASRQAVVLIDGYMVGVAALIACRIEPPARRALIASHRSSEPGHRHVLEALGLSPILDLELRLGEASGAALAWPILQSAARLFNEMATFEEAEVTES